MARRFGLAIDNLTGVQVVTADGTLQRANEMENPDLFWGVRGGSGNFGVVTSFEFRLHSMQRRTGMSHEGSAFRKRGSEARYG